MVVIGVAVRVVGAVAAADRERAGCDRKEGGRKGARRGRGGSAIVGVAAGGIAAVGAVVVGGRGGSVAIGVAVVLLGIAALTEVIGCVELVGMPRGRGTAVVLVLLSASFFPALMLSHSSVS